MAFQLTSTAFKAGGMIPRRYTCDNADVSPALAWSGLPAETKSLALICDDPDAPDPAAPRMTWVHWVFFNVPPSATGLPEAVFPHDLPAGTRQGSNDWNRIGYGGPCPPIGTHRYFFKLYALDTALNLSTGVTKADLLQAMDGHVLAETQLVGRYHR